MASKKKRKGGSPPAAPRPTEQASKPETKVTPKVAAKVKPAADPWPRRVIAVHGVLALVCASLALTILYHFSSAIQGGAGTAFSAAVLPEGLVAPVFAFFVFLEPPVRRIFRQRRMRFVETLLTGILLFFTMYASAFLIVRINEPSTSGKNDPPSPSASAAPAATATATATPTATAAPTPTPTATPTVAPSPSGAVSSKPAPSADTQPELEPTKPEDLIPTSMVADVIGVVLFVLLYPGVFRNVISPQSGQRAAVAKAQREKEAKKRAKKR